jgi:hypothetical protein
MSSRLCALCVALLWFASSGAAEPAAPHGDFRARSSLPAPGYVHRTQGWLWDFFGGPRHDREPPWTPAPSNSEERENDIMRTERPRLQQSGRYRTWCVRLCDGFPSPVSYATTRDRFSRDAKQCDATCPNRSRLFFHRMGADFDEMVDLKGEAYGSLKNAFRYRTEYVQDCTCRGNPWDEEAKARHRAYAEAEKASKERTAAAKAPAKARHEPRDRWARAQDGDNMEK